MELVACTSAKNPTTCLLSSQIFIWPCPDFLRCVASIILKMSTPLCLCACCWFLCVSFFWFDLFCHHNQFIGFPIQNYWACIQSKC
uniref:Uncharacterized protein n=1 Tax=Astatotilapia calliptera TaxID=8154 RepID=A0AAX7T6Z3_ASTCA